MNREGVLKLPFFPVGRHPILQKRLKIPFSILWNPHNQGKLWGIYCSYDSKTCFPSLWTEFSPAVWHIKKIFHFHGLFNWAQIMTMSSSKNFETLKDAKRRLYLSTKDFLKSTSNNPWATKRHLHLHDRKMISASLVYDRWIQPPLWIFTG